MSLRESAAQLTRATEDLMVKWSLTRDAWRDERAVRFEARYLHPLEAEVRRASDAMERMAGHLRTARAQCSPPSE